MAGAKPWISASVDLIADPLLGDQQYDGIAEICQIYGPRQVWLTLKLAGDPPIWGPCLIPPPWAGFSARRPFYDHESARTSVGMI